MSTRRDDALDLHSIMLDTIHSILNRDGTRIGIAALVCYGIHGSYHLYNGRPEDLLWACHIGAVLIGLGLIIPSASLSAVGTMQLCMGTPLWILDLTSGGEFMPTSVFTHVVALAIGIFAVRRYGMPTGVWWKSIGTLVILILLSRLVTPAEANINVAFAVQPGWEEQFASYPVYIVTMVAMAGIYFCMLEFVMRRWWAATAAEENGQ